ncbi:hypothetical protein [Paenibacillus sp. VTT E-133291]|uniref:hypothetical protein n=1 Tax=Paenibacillus sp. VTT E-133291 TaxID=1986223 RepID=UPI000BA08957|nr:hypothetical protein [Paenibacillus sp. VTT E-133291]OZQ97413.1 hypothetical protein CA598_06355 [Paenibacillus sp. VTT E-133291]
MEKQALSSLVPEGAAMIMEQLYLSGVYQNHKRTNEKIEQIKGAVKSLFYEDEKRRDWSQFGVVAKYIPSPRYEVDELRLKEYLCDLSIFVPSAKINCNKLKKDRPDIIKQLEPFANPVDCYVKMSPNVNGRVNTPDMGYSGLYEEALIQQWMCEKNKLDRTSKVMDKAKEKQLCCPIIAREKKLSCNYGSVSLYEKDYTYDVPAIYRELGMDFLFEFASVNIGTLYEKFVPKGFISPKEISHFRKVVGVDLKFMMLEKSAEDRFLGMLQDRIMQAAEKTRSLKEMEQIFFRAVG